MDWWPGAGACRGVGVGVGGNAGMDGIDRLLQIVAYYRRRQPQSPEVSFCDSPAPLQEGPYPRPLQGGCIISKTDSSAINFLEWFPVYE